jgi:3-phenylpropionate/trans-cinnamate dioxygenase ferredoxin subunit
MSQFVRVASISDIPIGTLKTFEVDYTRFVIAHTDSGFYAVIDECSHDSAPFAHGHIRGHEIMCPRHGARFDLRTGAVTAPPALVPIETLKVKVEGEDIFVELD